MYFIMCFPFINGWTAKFQIGRAEFCSEPVTPCMDVYKAKIQSDGSLEKLKLRFVVRVDLQNKEVFGDTWSPTASMRTLKYFLAYAVIYKARVHGRC